MDTSNAMNTDQIFNKPHIALYDYDKGLRAMIMRQMIIG